MLILDNCTSHFSKINSNVKLLFIPPNTIAFIQPLDMSIVKIIRDKHKTRISRYISSFINKDSLSLNSVKVIDCIIWLNDI